MENFSVLIVGVALIWKLVDFIKMMLPKLPPQAVQIIAWIVGAGVALLIRETDFASSVKVGTYTLDNVNAWSAVLFGGGLASTASALVDYKKARDNTDSAVIPSITETP